MLHRMRPLLLAATVMLAGADEPVRKPAEYPVHAPVGKYIVAAENLGPSVPGPSGGLYVDGYITIEVAVFPAGEEKRAALSHSAFGLRINGSKGLLRPDAPGFVSSAIKYPDWERQRGLEATAGVGGTGVILGRPDVVERFPGDRRPMERRRPVPNPVPPVGSPLEKQSDDIPVEEYVRRAALVEGEPVLPVRGCLFFPYKGKRKSIKRMELVYEGPMGDVALRMP